MRRHCPIWVVLIAALLHLLGMARSPLPAQDGLKFIRVARGFQTEPWADVIRSSDQHPLYPWCVAQVEPLLRHLIGPGPDAWRLAAQTVSMLASLVAVVALYRLTRLLFDRTAAALAAVLFAVLPGLVAIGHETLSDPLALMWFVVALYCGVSLLHLPTWSAAAGFALSSGLGYWTRPEAAILPVALSSVLLARFVLDRTRVANPTPIVCNAARAACCGPAVLGFLVLVGAYGLFKGELSEKLALRRTAGVASTHDAPRLVKAAVPRGLDRPDLDFSPKEEADTPTHASTSGANLLEIANLWASSLGWVFAVMAVYGALRLPAGPGSSLVLIYGVAFTTLLTRHVEQLGYLSDRHVLTLAVAALPWAAAGTMDASRRVAARLGWELANRGRRRRLAVAALSLCGLMLHLQPAHASRGGHQAAGRWLASHCPATEAVFDTRGWAAFLSGRRAYDAWHIKQALTDSRLGYMVVGADELDASSPRARTLRAILAFAAQPVAAFPGRADGSGVPVLVYRFQRPSNWEGLKP